jgi:hypothetical protein
MHKWQQSLKELFNDAVRKFEVILVFEERHGVTGYQVCKVLSGTLFARVQQQNLRGKIQVRRICFRSLTAL